MVIPMCDCNDGIPGVESLPWHIHRDFARVMITGEDHPNRGEVIEIPWDSWVLNLSNPAFEAIERIQELAISVDWKAVAKA